MKHLLKIKNPECIAFDILFGCPGWVQGVIQAEAFIKSGIASKCLVIGSETLSRVVDPFDRDSMIYSDGAAACVIEKTDKNDGGRILSSAAQSHTFEETYFLFYGQSYNPDLLYYRRPNGMSASSSTLANKIFISLLLTFYLKYKRNTKLLIQAILFIGIALTFNRTVFAALLFFYGFRFIYNSIRYVQRLSHDRSSSFLC